MKKRIVVSIMLSALALGLGGCAQEVGDIDRTQPNKLRKNIFADGSEWYVRQTVVDVPGTAQVSFEGFEGDVNRIRFDVREDVLVARRAHEDVLGIDHATDPSLDPNVKPGLSFDIPDDYLGAPVAAFPIVNHFDVQRSYNPATGEQSNVLIENSSDRVWNERKFMRVNWNTNLVFSADMPISFDYSPDIANRPQLSWYEDRGNSLTPIYIECLDENGEYYDCDPDNLGEDEEVGYMELTNAYVIEPDWISCILTFGFPLYGGFCGSETIKVRTSFVKVNHEENNTYEPRVYSDNEMNWFGFFRTERCTYDRLYGCRDQSTIYLANRHKLWNTFFTDRNDNGKYDYGVDEYLPYSARTPRPIVYYLTDNFPVDLLDENLKVADSYNETFASIVRQANDPNYSGRMFYLCANSGSEEERAHYEAAAAELTKHGGGEFVNANAPGDFNDLWTRLTVGYEQGVCKRQGKAKVLGDMRYSYFAWIDNPQQNGPLGYGPSSADPLTGWVFNADAHIYGADLDWYVQYNVDLIDLVNGDLDPLAFGFGENVTGYLEDAYDRFGIPHNGWGHLSAVDQHSITSVDLEKLGKLNEKIVAAEERLTDPRFVEKLRIDPHQLARKDDRYRNTWERIKGTPLDAKLLIPEIKAGLGAGLVAPDADVTEDVIDAISLRKTGLAPANGMRSIKFDNKSNNSNDYWDRFDRFASRNIYMAEFMDDHLLGLAMMLREKYQGESNDLTRRLKLWYWLRGYIYEEVQTHEVGHTVGLRHNFEGSYDSMSFDPKYWEIREETNRQLADDDGTVSCSVNADCTEELVPGLAKACSAGVCRTPCPSAAGIFLTDAHCPSRGLLRRDLENRITEYAYSSIMDYGSRGTSQTHGLGLWDKAALHYGYADLVHVFKKDAEPKKFQVLVDENGSMLKTGGITTSTTNISDWNDIEIVTGLNTEGLPAGDDFIDANLNYWHYSVLNLMFDVKGNNGMSKMYEREYIPLAQYDVNSPTRLRVPYRFCSDEFNGATPYCRVFDAGSDFQEIMNTLVQGYESYYFLNSYRRGRAGWGLWLWPYLTRLQSRYFSPMASIYQHWLIRASQWNQFDYFWQTNAFAGKLSQVASEDGLRTLLSVLNTPHPGTYVKCAPNSTDPECLDFNDKNPGFDVYINVANDDNYRLNESGTQNYLRLAPGEKAKWRFSRFDYDSGYYYFLRYQILSSFWDRWAAFMALTNPEYNDIGVDSSSDITGYMIPYYLIYDFELSKTFGGIMTEDWNSFTPVVNVASLQEGKSWRQSVEYRDPLASASQSAAYQNPARYTTLNPYPASYGQSSYNDRFFAAVYGIAFFQVMYDMSFNHASNIFIINDGGFGTLFADSDGDGAYDIQEGHGDSNGDGIPDFLDPNFQPATLNMMPSFETFKDPFNHKVYAAVSYTNTRAPLYSPGAKIIRRANEVKALWQAGRASSWEVQNVREDMENMMLCNKVFSDFNSPAWIVDM